MKKFTPYLIAFGVVGLIAIFVLAANRPRKMDERITLRTKDQIPYGFAVAKQLSGSLFTDADVFKDDNAPGSWDRISMSSTRQAVVIVGGFFNADEYEIRQLMKFVENGNYVFIIAQSFSTEAQAAFHFTSAQNGLSFLTGVEDDSLKLRLASPPFASDSFYIYPGRKFESWFENIDTAHAVVLGANETGPDFIRMDRGDGSFFIHSAPLAFSNYFILHKNNVHYFEQVMSVLPSDLNRIVWNEYYLVTRNPSRSSGSSEPNWLGVLFAISAFKWGFLTLLFLLLLWVLLNSRRRQRMIPAYVKPKNESLDFVKTMGRLYYDRRDHENLARKMAVYFLEYVRSTYKLATHTLDETFIEALHYKSGYPKEDLHTIVSFIHYLQENPGIDEHQLTNFHNQLESFYQNT
jgi:hypothetical protein